MIQFLAPLLGGLGGLLFPAAGAAAAGGAAATGIGALLAKAALPALGAGLGTIVSGGSGKDAIRNALLMGVGVNALPGLAGDIQKSNFGKSITGGLADIFGIGAERVSGPPQTAGAYSAPPRRPGAGTPAPLGGAPGMGSPMAPLGGFGPSGMESEVLGRRGASTLPSLSEMAAMDAMRREQDAAAAFDLFGGMPPSPMEYARQGFENAMGMGMAEPRFMPITGDIGRSRDMELALSMARDRAALGDIEGSMDLLDIYNRRARPGLRGFAEGGEIEGPGTGTSDSIPAEIYQDGKPVQKAALSDGEFVMTAKAVKGAGNGNRERGVSRMYELMRRFESGEMA